MKHSILISTVLLALSVSACDRSPAVIVPAPVAVPGPAGPQGATGSQGITGSKGEPGDTTASPAASEPPKN